MEGEEITHQARPRMVSIVKSYPPSGSAVQLQALPNQKIHQKVIRAVQVRTPTGERVTIPERLTQTTGFRYVATSGTPTTKNSPMPANRSLLINGASPVLRTPTGNTILKIPTNNPMRIIAPQPPIGGNVVILKDGYPINVRRSFSPAPNVQGRSSPLQSTAQKLLQAQSQARAQAERIIQNQNLAVAQKIIQTQKITQPPQSSQPQPQRIVHRLSQSQLQRITQSQAQKQSQPHRVGQQWVPQRQRQIMPQLQAQLIPKQWVRRYHGPREPELIELDKPDVNQNKEAETSKEKEGQNRVEEAEEEEDHVGGVEDYLFGPSKKPKLYERKVAEITPSVPEAKSATKCDQEPTPAVVEAPPRVNKVSRRKQQTQVLLDVGEELPTPEVRKPVEEEKKNDPEEKQIVEKQNESEEKQIESDEKQAELEASPEEVKEDVKLEETLEEGDAEMLQYIQWSNQIGSLPGLSGISFRINENNLLEIVDDQNPLSPSPEEPVPKRGRGSEEWLTCEHCGTYGMATEFVDSRFCGRICREERDARRAVVRQEKRNRKDRKRKLRLQLKKLTAQRRSLDVNNLTEARDVLDVEIFRLRMQLELTKLEMTDGKMVYRQYPSISEYLAKIEPQAAPSYLFRDALPPGKNPFKVGWKMEAIDPRHPGLICVVTVVETRGYRIKLRFDGYGANHDYWVNANSAEIFQPGWCERTDHKLTPPRGWEGSFNWTIYLEQFNATAAPRHAFAHSQERTMLPSGFRVGMKLEAVDKKHSRFVCVASIADVIDNRILVHIDGSPDKFDYWAENNSPYIHPAGWCADNGHLLQPPPDEDNFRWDSHSLEHKSFIAPARAFKLRAPHEFKKGMKLEAVDKRNPDLIRIATVVDTERHQIRIKFDGWPVHYAYWVDDDSPDIHPLGWCSKTGHPLEPTPTPESMSLFSACPIPGCIGIGHAFRVSGEHTTPIACPYAPCNYQCDDLVSERFSSTAEYLTVKEYSHSKGTKPRNLLSRRVRLMDAKKPSEKLKRRSDPPVVQQPLAKKVARDGRCGSSSSNSSETADEPAQVARLAKIAKELAEKVADFPPNPRAWTTEEVGQFVDKFLGPGKGEIFEEHIIDGEALLMVAQADLTEHLRLKFGPALTIYSCVQLLRKRALDCDSQPSF